MNKKKERNFFYTIFLVAFYQFFFLCKTLRFIFYFKKYLKRLFPLNHLATIFFFFVFYNFLLLNKKLSFLLLHAW